MKNGELIKDYLVLTDPSGGAQGQWALAQKGPEVYFLKQFLSPKYPGLNGPGSAAVREKKLADCAQFEQRNRHLHSSLNSNQLGAGNLVVATEFFRVGTTYYKATNVVVGCGLESVRSLSPHQALVVIRTLLLSVRLLHKAGFVHGDLKPENVVIQETRPGIFVSKLIDFDDGYIVGLPPGRDQVVGDQRFYSPELLRYIKDDASTTGEDLTTASDMFALGLLIHFLLTDRLPSFDRERYSWAAEAAMHHELEIDGVKGPVKAWLEMLTKTDRHERPLIDDLLYFFLDFTAEELSDCLFTLSGRKLAPKPKMIEPDTELPEKTSTLKSTIKKK